MFEITKPKIKEQKQKNAPTYQTNVIEFVASYIIGVNMQLSASKKNGTHNENPIII